MEGLIYGVWGDDFRGKLQLYKVGGLSHSPAPMILADILSISIKLLLVVHVLVSALLILVVLMQRPKQEGLGAAFGGGVTDQVFGAQTTNVLQKGTVYLGTLFMLLSLGLAILIGNKNHQAGINKVDPPAVEAATVPGELPDGGSVTDALEEAEGDAPAPEGDAPAPEGDDAPAPEGEAPAPDAADDAAAPVEGEGETSAEPAEGEEDN